LVPAPTAINALLLFPGGPDAHGPVAPWLELGLNGLSFLAVETRGQNEPSQENPYLKE